MTIYIYIYMCVCVAIIYTIFVYICIYIYIYIYLNIICGVCVCDKYPYNVFQPPAASPSDASPSLPSLSAAARPMPSVWRQTSLRCAGFTKPWVTGFSWLLIWLYLIMICNVYTCLPGNLWIRTFFVMYLSLHIAQP